MSLDSIRAIGTLKIVKTDAQGISTETILKNIVTDVGKSWIAARLITAGLPTAMSHMAIGTGVTAAAAGQTTLVTEAGRVALGGSTVSGAKVTYTATFGAGVGTGSITEAGVFNAAGAGAGTMLNRTTFSAIAKGASDTISITWDLTIQ